MVIARKAASKMFRRRNRPDHWMLTSQRNGEQLPEIVTQRWRWYVNATYRNRLRYAAAEITALSTAAAIPVVAAAGVSSVVSAALGAAVLVASGLRATFQVHENWISHARSRYRIETEAALFLVKAVPYADNDAVRILVSRVETLSTESGDQWAERRRQLADQTGGGAIPPVRPTPS